MGTNMTAKLTDDEIKSMLFNLALEKGNDYMAIVNWFVALPNETRTQFANFMSESNNQEGLYPAWYVEFLRIKRDVHGVDIFVPKNPELWKDYWNNPGSSPKGHVEPLPRTVVNT